MFIKNSEDINNLKVRQSYGMLAGIFGIILNIILFIIKLIAGFFTSSIAVFADAFNNIFDAASSAVTLIGFKMSGKPADKDHPFGHGRIEYVSGLVVSMIIITIGFQLLINSVEKIISPQNTNLSFISIAILILSIILKLWMSFSYRYMGKKINSHTLITASLDSFFDVISTIVVILSMIIWYAFKINVDGFAGMIVAIFIIYTGIKSAKETLDFLLGQSPDKDFVDLIEKTVLEDEEILGVHDLIVHNYGPGRSVVSLHAEVRSDVNLMDIHHVIDVIERKFKTDMDCEVVIHIDPIEVNDERTNQIKNKMSALIKLIDPTLKLHDFRMVDENTHTDLIFDVVVPHNFRLSDEETKVMILNAAKTIDENFEVIIYVDKM